MASRTSKRSNEQTFCWEQVAKTNRLFRVSHAFAPTRHAPKLLPLYALFSVVEEACSRYSDEYVARSKLAWWRQECLGRDPGKNSHPIIKELSRNAHLGLREQRWMARLLDDAEDRLDAAAPATLDDLWRRCTIVSQPQLELELSLCGVEEAGCAGIENRLGSRSGLVQLLRESLRGPNASAYWWLPLELLARHGVSRAEVQSAPGSDSVQALFVDILGWGDAFGVQPGPVGEDSVGRLDSVSHLQVLSALQSRLLRRLRTRSPEQYPAEVNRTTLGDLYQAWKTARQVNRV
jgi:phytoene synthase